MRDQAAVETAVVDALIDGSASFSSLTDAEVLVAVDELGARRRLLDAALVAAAGELAARSDGLPAEQSLVRRGGHATPAQAMQHRIGLRHHEARQLCAVAEATRARVSLTGASIPIAFPHVAAALASGWLSMPQAHAIVDGLGRSDGRAAPHLLEQAEQLLVTAGCGSAAADEAPAVPETLAVLARHCLAHLDPDGAEPRHDAQVAARFLRIRHRADGLVHGEFVCTADQGETIQTALDAHVKPRRPRFQDACGALDEAGDDVDDRTREQRRLDALVTIVARHAETHSPRIAGEAPTLTITVSEDALHGRGSRLADIARLGRSGEPVPVSVAARILCDGFVQPVVQDAAGEPLRLGRRQRLFSRSQRRAIIARDQHCRAPGCTAPPGWCETHHVSRWADDGPTDVDNGILLCQHHHTETHRGALVIHPATVDPATVDPATVPARTVLAGADRPGGTRRWRVAAAHARRPRTRGPSRP